MRRYADWPTLLDSFLRAHASERFQYGRWDCALFVADAVQAMTGVDVAAKFRGHYGSRREALRAIKEYTGSTSIRAIAETVFAEHGLREVAVARAQRGDAVLVRRGRDWSLGIVALDGAGIVSLAKDSLLRWPLSRAETAWRI